MSNTIALKHTRRTMLQLGRPHYFIEGKVVEKLF